MPTPTYTPLANLTLTGSASSITFSSISQAYRDLILVAQIKSNADDKFFIRLNAATTGHTSVSAEGSGSTTASSASTAWPEAITAGMGWNAITANEFAPFVVNLMDYSATDKHKSVLIKGGSITTANTASGIWAGRYASTSAVTQIRLYGNGTWLAGTTLALYGIAS